MEQLGNRVAMPAKQNNLALFGGVVNGGTYTHTTAQVLACKDDRDVFIEMMRVDPIRGRRDAFYAQQLGISRSYLSRMLEGSREFKLTGAQWKKMARLTRSRLHAQWTALDQDNSDLVPHVESIEEENQRLRAELAQRSA